MASGDHTAASNMRLSSGVAMMIARNRQPAGGRDVSRIIQ
jgi:hypothetical protein